ncbi:MAG: DPP IV N-terminal domain-containing protein [Planctomycetota bacterium]
MQRLFFALSVALSLLFGVDCQSSSSADETPKAYGYRLKPHWILDGAKFWYRVDRRGSDHEFFLVDPATLSMEPCFNPFQFKESVGLGAEEALPVEHLRYADDGQSVLLIGKSRSWSLDLSTDEIKEVNHQDNSLRRLHPMKKVERSRGQREDTHVIFENHLTDSFDIYWVNVSGEKVFYHKLNPGKSHVQHTHARHVWLIKSNRGSLAFRAELEDSRVVVDEELFSDRDDHHARSEAKTFVASRNGKWQAFVRDHNLWIRNRITEEEISLSDGGNESSSFQRSAQRTRAMSLVSEKRDYPATLPEAYWSADSSKLIALRTDRVQEHAMTLVESSPDDQLLPRMHRLPYLRPGHAIPTQHVHLFDISSQAEIPVSGLDLENPYKLDRFRWSRSTDEFFYLFNPRGHQFLKLVAIDTNSGESRVVVNETSDTFVDYALKTYVKHLPNTNELIWMSERSGWNHLYLYDRGTGKVKNPITAGQWVVRAVEHVDVEERVIWFSACGIVPEQDPSYIHHCKVNFDGSELTVLTEGDGTHEIDFSPDRRFLIDSWSRVDLPPCHVLRSGDNGQLLLKLETTDVSELKEAGTIFPERFHAKGRDDKTDIYGIIHRPQRFDPAEKYPVIENIYSSPSGQYVPKNFRWTYKHQRELADRGFVVVNIDGMGTNWRSRAFHNVAWQNLADAGFPDRIRWIKAAAIERPWMDINRVGIYGGSAGGQNSMRAVLDHAQFYKAAVADCGCHDNRIDKLWWNEAWMGWPVGQAYIDSSNVEHAARLNGHLLLSVGEMDRNVDPVCTYQVVDALTRAGKQFELLVQTGRGHAAIESEYGRRRRIDFFLRHLGKEAEKHQSQE